MNNVYAITDIEGYAKEMRQCAAKSLADNYDENLDEFITINQTISIVDDACLGYDENDRPLIDEETNSDIFDLTVTWIHNAGLSKLAAKGLIECAWDDESNEMVFWVTSNQSTINKPEIANDGKPKTKNSKFKG